MTVVSRHNDLVDREEPYFIDLPGDRNLQIIGTLRDSLEEPFQRPMALLLHGNMGDRNDLLQYNAARYLSRLGIASLRLSMYEEEEHHNLRNRLDVTQQVYAEDVTASINHLRDKGVGQLFGIGHSAGGLALLMAAPSLSLDAIALWDPSHGSCWEKYKEDLLSGERVGPNKELILQRGGYGFIRSVHQVEFEVTMGSTTKFAKGKQNLIVVSASEEKGVLTSYGKRYVDAASEPKEHVILPGAGHCFNEGEVMRDLFRITGSWFQQQM